MSDAILHCPSRPQLVFKDGTISTASDYWRTDDQLHFQTTEEWSRTEASDIDGPQLEWSPREAV